MRIVLLSLVLAAGGCGDQPFQQPSNRMGDANAVAPGPPDPSPPTGSVQAENCPGRAPLGEMLAPLGRGPLALTAIRCSDPERTPRHPQISLVSPDGRSVAALDIGPDMAVTVQPVTGEGAVSMPAGAAFSQLLEMRGPMALAWSRDSQFLWGVRQPRVRPNGWALAGLRPMRFQVDGTAVELPPLTHRAGPLDGVNWAGGDGLGLAVFGMKGMRYRPEHEDPAPALAFVDAARGRILDTLLVASVPGVERGIDDRLRLRAAAVTRLPNGRLRALLDTSRWVVWTQGERPRIIARPSADQVLGDLTFTADGSRMLVTRQLQTEGVICSEPSGGCTRGTPVEGVFASLYDLGSGRALWEVRGRVVTGHVDLLPAISPDGRHALISLPSEDSESRLGLLDLRSGRIIQRLPAAGRPDAAGFIGNGSFWVRASNITAFYRVARR